MKRMIMTLVAVWVMITSMNAQRLTNIQAEARFITDKMVVELGLSSVQRNSILNINLNYLNGIRSYRDIDAYGWHYRNKQLKRMMTARQWKRFKDSYYFYRPIGWQNHVYVHHIYTKYPKHNWGHDKRRPRPECSYGRPGWPGGTHVTYGPGKPGKHTSITNTTRSGSTTRRNGSTIEIGMMMMMIEIMTGMKTKIKTEIKTNIR